MVWFVRYGKYHKKALKMDLIHFGSSLSDSVASTEALRIWESQESGIGFFGVEGVERNPDMLEQQQRAWLIYWICSLPAWDLMLLFVFCIETIREHDSQYNSWCWFTLWISPPPAIGLYFIYWIIINLPKNTLDILNIQVLSHTRMPQVP